MIAAEINLDATSYFSSVLAVFPILLTVLLQADAKIVPRTNYGVFFESKGYLHLYSHSWTHTFEVRLPHKIHLPLLPLPCGTAINTSACEHLDRSVEHVNFLRQQGEQVINATITDIHSLLPETTHTKPTRTRRSLIPFLGKIGHSLFGLATDDDIKAVKMHISQLQKHQDELFAELVQQNFSSYMKITDRRISNVMTAAQFNFHALTSLRQTWTSQMDDMYGAMSSIITFLADSVRIVTELETRLEKFHHGLILLKQGTLSEYIIPTKEINQVIQTIMTKLVQKHKHLALVNKDPTSYYNSNSFILTRYKHSIYVTIKFPLSTYKSPFILYRIRTLPVPLNDSTTHASKVSHLSEYFALSSELHLTLSKQDMSECYGKSYKTCHSLLPTNTFSHQTCEFALFQDLTSTVHTLCDFNFIPNGLKPQVMQISTHQFLVSNVSKMSVQCNDHSYDIDGCQYCQINIPCHCSLSAHTYKLALTSSTCSSQQGNATILYPFNLALLQHFFHETVFANLSGDTLYSKSPKANIPNIVLYKHKMSNIIASDHQDHLSLAKMAQAAKTKQVVFQSLAHSLLYDQENDHPWSMSLVFSLVSLIVSLMTFIGAIWLFRKTYILAMAIQLLQDPIKVATEQIPVFDYYDHATDSSHDTNQQTDVDKYVSNLVIYNATVISVILFSCIAIKIAKWVNRAAANTTFLLEVTNGKESLALDIVNLAKDAHVWQLTQRTPPTLKVIGSVLPHLQLHWHGTNLISDALSIAPPSRVKISFLKARSLKRIIQKGNYESQCYIRQLNVKVSPTVKQDGDHDTNKLYPELHKICVNA